MRKVVLVGMFLAVVSSYYLVSAAYADGGSRILSGVIYSESFESGGLAGWSFYAAAAPGDKPKGDAIVVTTGSRDGNNSLKISGTNGVGDAYVFKRIGGLVVGRQYTFSAFVRSLPGSVGKASINVQTIPPGRSVARKDVPLSGLREWTQVSLTFIARATDYEFDLLANEMVGGGELYFDAVAVEEGTEAGKYVTWLRTKQPEEQITSYFSPEIVSCVMGPPVSRSYLSYIRI